MEEAMQSLNKAPKGGQDGQGDSDRQGTARKLAIGAGLASLAFAGFAIALIVTPGNNVQVKMSLPSNGSPPASALSTPAAPEATAVNWIVAAPGRVEPRSGQIHIAAAVGGTVAAILVAINDKVAEGEVLIRLEDTEARARLAAAEAEASARKRERDAQPATSGREDVRKAEDAVYTAERAVATARFELDDAISADRRSTGNARLLSNARSRLAEAKEHLRHEQAALSSAQGKANLPAPNRFEAALIAGRSDVTLAETLLDKTRIRAPIAGTILQVGPKVGELVAAVPDQPLVVIGDMSVVRVRAEVDEQDVGKVRIGQRVFVRNSAYPGRDFEGKVVEMAPSLALPRMGSRGVRRATDVEVMEVLVDLDGLVPLLPGMRVDTFFRR
jgi:HlyD family secretion protein